MSYFHIYRELIEYPPEACLDGKLETFSVLDENPLIANIKFAILFTHNAVEIFLAREDEGLLAMTQARIALILTSQMAGEGLRHPHPEYEGQDLGSFILQDFRHPGNLLKKNARAGLDVVLHKISERPERYFCLNQRTGGAGEYKHNIPIVSEMLNYRSISPARFTVTDSGTLHTNKSNHTIE